MTAPAMVRAFAEDPTADFFEDQNGARITAHMQTELHWRVQRLSDKMSEGKKKAVGERIKLEKLEAKVRCNDIDTKSQIDRLIKDVAALKLHLPPPQVIPRSGALAPSVSPPQPGAPAPSAPPPQAPVHVAGQAAQAEELECEYEAMIWVRR